MAVAARTYAARLRGRHAREGFDFCATTHCQRLDLAGINERVTKAAAATQGELLWFEGKPAFSVYSRACGGRTEVWPDLTVPYLKVQRDPYCRPAVWTWAATPSQLILALKASGLSVPDDLANVSILERTASGRARTLALVGKTRSVPIAAGSFRFAIGRALGWNTLRSDQYEVDHLHFRGQGTGARRRIVSKRRGRDGWGREELPRNSRVLLSGHAGFAYRYRREVDAARRRGRQCLDGPARARS